MYIFTFFIITMKRSYLEEEEMHAFKKGNDLLSISNRYKKMAMTQLKYGEALTKCITLLDELNELKKDNSCPICYKTFTVKITGKCTHSVCLHCYRNLIYPKLCPLCRSNFENDLEDSDEEEEEEEQALGGHTTYNEDDDTLPSSDDSYDSLEDVLNNAGFIAPIRGTLPNDDQNQDLSLDGTRGGGL